MIALLTAGEDLTSRRCETEFGVTRDTMASDFALLVKLGVARKQGKGRAVRYALAHIS
jgi:ATP-dependent DNA helicase RecG